MRTAPLTLLTALVAVLPAQAPAETKDRQNLVEIAVAADDFNTLVAAVKAAGLVETLSGKGPFTIFAPTDAAFAKLGKKTINDLLKPENKGKLAAILTYHVAGANMPAGKVIKVEQIETLQGQSLDVNVSDAGVKIGNANVVKTDIIGSNGVIHVIDTVLLPKELPANIVVAAQEAGQFKTLIAAAKAAGLAKTLMGKGPFTVFAPTDEAFAALGQDTIANLLKPENKEQLAAILKFHVVAGKVMSPQASKLKAAPTLLGQDLVVKATKKGLTIGGANVVAADIETGNGVIHVIDTVLLPKK